MGEREGKGLGVASITRVNTMLSRLFLLMLLLVSSTVFGFDASQYDAVELSPSDGAINGQSIPLPSPPLSTHNTLLADEVMAVAYSGFRVGQHPDRGAGAINPSKAQISEDLDLLVSHGFRLIRLYDSGANSATVLELIRQRQLPIKVLLGIWLRAELSNHLGCPWLTEPIPQHTLTLNNAKNASELARGVALAKQYKDTVVAVNVGNEALVEWNDHMVSTERVISYVRSVKAAIAQPVTVAENYLWWLRSGAALAKEVDFIGVHTYPIWENKTIDEGMAYTIQNVEDVRIALPGHRIAILEAGWASVSEEFTVQSNEANQRRYFRELQSWAAHNNTTVFFFEAFDEPWKGDPNRALGAEKHWGLFTVDRTPKAVLRYPDLQEHTINPGGQ